MTKLSLTVRWKKYDSTEYYSYNPENGLLYILVNTESQNGYLIRSDINAGGMMRKYQREILEGVPTEDRLFAECSKYEYGEVWHEVVSFTNDSFRTTLLETF